MIVLAWRMCVGFDLAHEELQSKWLCTGGLEVLKQPGVAPRDHFDCIAGVVLLRAGDADWALTWQHGSSRCMPAWAVGIERCCVVRIQPFAQHVSLPCSVHLWCLHTLWCSRQHRQRPHKGPDEHVAPGLSGCMCQGCDVVKAYFLASLVVCLSGYGMRGQAPSRFAP